VKIIKSKRLITFVYTNVILQSVFHSLPLVGQ